MQGKALFPGGVGQTGGCPEARASACPSAATSQAHVASHVRKATAGKTPLPLSLFSVLKELAMALAWALQGTEICGPQGVVAKGC